MRQICLSRLFLFEGKELCKITNQTTNLVGSRYVGKIMNLGCLLLKSLLSILGKIVHKSTCHI